jgi:hypothetical protein
MGHVYYRKWGDRVGAVLLLIVGAVFCTTIWSDLLSPHNPKPLALLASAVLLVYGIYQTANAFISAVTLFEDSIELRTAFSQRSLLFSATRGRREYVTSGRYRTAYFSLVPGDDRSETLEFVQAYNFDEAFFSWFNRIPDLDAADEKKESRVG